MQAVILAAGKGKRLLPLTEDLPKGMLPINGKPLLQIILEQLKAVNIGEVIFIVNFCQEKIINYFGDGSKFGVKISYVRQKERKGTADAVLQAERVVTGDKFVCIACDSLFENSLLPRLLSNSSKANGVITCREVSDTKGYGVLRLAPDKSNLPSPNPAFNQVLEIVEKPEQAPSNLANFSVYLFPREIFAACQKVKPSARGELEINDAIKMLIDSGQQFTYVKSQDIIDIGTFEQLSEANGIDKRLRL